MIHPRTIVFLLLCLFGAMLLGGAAWADPPHVVCVPFISQNTTVPHDTWSGKEITLKGTAHDPDGDSELDIYIWDPGDGSAPYTGNVTNPFAIEAKHTYTGDIGRFFVARLTVTDINGQSHSDDYLIIIRDYELDVRVNVAIDEGLWRLHKDMTRATYPDGQEYGYWSYSSYSAGCTGACIEAFEVQGSLPEGSLLIDPYVDTVRRGLNFLLNQMHTHAISVQPAGDPDSNKNGIGISCYSYSGSAMYECGIILMTFASSMAFDRIALTGPPGVVGETYTKIVQDMVDYIAFGQCDSSNSYRGGWRYTANAGDSDNSCAQWPVIGLEAADTNFNKTKPIPPAPRIIIPSFVKPELNYWIDYIQNDSNGGAGYTGPSSTNIARTGAVLCEMKFVGDDASTQRVINAENYVENYWSSAFNPNYYAFYSVMKGLRLLGIVTLPGGLDWYEDPVHGYAIYLVNSEGSGGNWGCGVYASHPLSSAWALLTLKKSIFTLLPVAVAGPDVPSYPPSPVEYCFDGSGSYHVDPARSIVEYCWDFESDGIWDVCSPEPIACHAFPVFYLPGGEIDWDATTKTYVVTLRVKDDSEEPQHDQDQCVMDITPPPYPPVADCNGPYFTYLEETVTLDGSGSYDPNEEAYPDPGHPWHGYLVSYEWDLDNDGQFDDATGVYVPFTPVKKGIVPIALKVANNFGLDDICYGTVHVENHPPVAEAGGPYTLFNNQVTLDGSGSTDPDPGETETLRFRWDFDCDGCYDTPWSSDPTMIHTYPTCEKHMAMLEVMDVNEATATDTAMIVPLAYFSTYTTHTLHNNTSFPLYDRDIARIDVVTGHAELSFAGIFYKIATLNAMDIVYLAGRQNPVGLLFAVREDKALESWDGNFFARKQDVVYFDSFTESFSQFFDGVSFNIPGIDALALLDDGRLVISPTDDWSCPISSDRSLFFREQDLAVYDPVNNTVLPYLTGETLKIHTLDAVEILDQTIYFSVRVPEYVSQPGAPVYLTDGDIAAYDVNTGMVSLYMLGYPFHVYDLDALSMGVDPDAKLLRQDHLREHPAQKGPAVK